MRKVYRANFFLDAKYRERLSPGSMFLSAESDDQAKEMAIKQFKEELKSHNMEQVPFTYRVYHSDEKEAINYIATTTAGYTTQRMVN